MPIEIKETGSGDIEPVYIKAAMESFVAMQIKFSEWIKAYLKEGIGSAFCRKHDRFLLEKTVLPLSCSKLSALKFFSNAHDEIQQIWTLVNDGYKSKDPTQKARAAWALGFLHELNISSTPDICTPKQALKYYKEAAQSNLPEAHYRLGVLALNEAFALLGHEYYVVIVETATSRVSNAVRMAKSHLEQARASNFPLACLMLSFIYARNDLPKNPRDQAKALSYINEVGNITCATSLFVLFAQGNINQLRCYVELVADGYPGALYELAKRKPHDIPLAVELYKFSLLHDIPARLNVSNDIYRFCRANPTSETMEFLARILFDNMSSQIWPDNRIEYSKLLKEVAQVVGAFPELSLKGKYYLALYHSKKDVVGDVDLSWLKLLSGHGHEILKFLQDDINRWNSFTLCIVSSIMKSTYSIFHKDHPIAQEVREELLAFSNVIEMWYWPYEVARQLDKNKIANPCSLSDKTLLFWITGAVACYEKYHADKTFDYQERMERLKPVIHLYGIVLEGRYFKTETTQPVPDSKYETSSGLEDTGPEVEAEVTLRPVVVPNLTRALTLTTVSTAQILKKLPFYKDPIAPPVLKPIFAAVIAEEFLRKNLRFTSAVTTIVRGYICGTNEAKTENRLRLVN